MSRAAYMREYRAKRAGLAKTRDTLSSILGDGQPFELAARLADSMADKLELEAEVARLKRELAARPTFEYGAAAGFNTRPFTPVPKPGKGK